MNRLVTHGGSGGLHVCFPFDRSLVDRIKTLPHRRWNSTERFWWIHEEDVVALVDLLRDEGFQFDTATIDLYTRSGGTAELTQSGSDPAPRLPGLFDDPDDEGPSDDRGVDPRGEHDYTVGRLNEQVRSVITSAFPAPIWLVGEISGFNKSTHRRHVTFELVERLDDGAPASKIPATLFESSRRTIEKALLRAGGPFKLEDEILVRMCVCVELYVPWGQYRVVVEELDVNYTLGEAARRRDEIVRRLTEDGLAERNRSLPLPELPLRIALLTSLGSDAYKDVLRTLEESGFAFRVIAHGARVQGKYTEPTVLNGLDWFRRRTEQFDVLIICRGGGSRTDLLGFDSEVLGRSVAEFPLPVIVGIGHEQDRSVLDAVARSCKTPTAAARLLVDAARESLSRVEERTRRIVQSARVVVSTESSLSLERGTRLARAVRSLLRHEGMRLAHQRKRAAVATSTFFAASRQRLARWMALIPRGASLHLERRHLLLRSTTRSILLAARREGDRAGSSIARLAEQVAPAVSRLLVHERERQVNRVRRLHLVDPRRVLERGYAILRLGDGRLLTRADQAPEESRVRAQLRSGVLRLRSEGEEERGGN